MNKHTVMGKHALVLHAKGEKEIAAQLFVYDNIREIRLDLEKLEVKVLMNYDEAYFRVFSVKPSDKAEEMQEAKQKVLGFYNALVNTSMKLTKEEQEHLGKQQKEAIAKLKNDKEA